MTEKLPANFRKIWRKGQKAKAQGRKEVAMKNFLFYFDFLTICLQSHNLPFNETMLHKRLKAVKGEIRQLLRDEEYIRTTIMPPEGIREIQAAIGMVEEKPLTSQQVELGTSMFVKSSSQHIIEVEHLILIETHSTSRPNERILEIEVKCQGQIQRFPYDTLRDSQLSLATLARSIQTSDGREFSSCERPEGTYLFTTTYPSIQNLLADYLVEGGWLRLEEGAQIEVVGYPSKHSSLPKIMDM